MSATAFCGHLVFRLGCPGCQLNHYKVQYNNELNRHSFAQQLANRLAATLQAEKTVKKGKGMGPKETADFINQQKKAQEDADAAELRANAWSTKHAVYKQNVVIPLHEKDDPSIWERTTTKAEQVAAEKFARSHCTADGPADDLFIDESVAERQLSEDKTETTEALDRSFIPASQDALLTNLEGLQMAVKIGEKIGVNGIWDPTIGLGPMGPDVATRPAFMPYASTMDLLGLDAETLSTTVVTKADGTRARTEDEIIQARKPRAPARYPQDQQLALVQDPTNTRYWLGVGQKYEAEAYEAGNEHAADADDVSDDTGGKSLADNLATVSISEGVSYVPQHGDKITPPIGASTFEGLATYILDAQISFPVYTEFANPIGKARVAGKKTVDGAAKAYQKRLADGEIADLQYRHDGKYEPREFQPSGKPPRRKNDRIT